MPRYPAVNVLECKVNGRSLGQTRQRDLEENQLGQTERTALRLE
jgi:hypothetical protein